MTTLQKGGKERKLEDQQLKLSSVIIDTKSTLPLQESVDSEIVDQLQERLSVLEKTVNTLVNAISNVKEKNKVLEEKNENLEKAIKDITYDEDDLSHSQIQVTELNTNNAVLLACFMQLSLI